MNKIPEIPQWKFYAITSKNRFVLQVEDACQQALFNGATLLLRQHVSGLKNIVVSNITDNDDGSYLIRSTGRPDFSVSEGYCLEVVNPDLTPMRWTIRETNRWIIEHQGLHEGMIVTYDDTRILPDGIEVPENTPGVLAKICDNGTCVVHWRGFAIEYGVDPSGLEEYGEFTFNAPPYDVISEKVEELERLRAENRRLLGDSATMRVFVNPLDLGGINPPARPLDAGYDLKSVAAHYLNPGDSEVVVTGACVELPAGHCGLVVGRSGLNMRGVICLIGLVDSGYRGAIRVALFNGGKTPFKIEAGDRVAQLLVIPYSALPLQYVESADELSATERGADGFGSTGVK